MLNENRNAWGGGGRLDEYFLLASTFSRSTNAHEDPRRSGTARTWYWWYPLAISPSMVKFHLWSPGLLRSCWKWAGRCSGEMSRELLFEGNFLGSSFCSNRFKGQYMLMHGNTICSKSTYRYCDFKRFGHSDALRSKPECCHSRIVVVKPSSEDNKKICKLGWFLFKKKKISPGPTQHMFFLESAVQSHGLTCWLAFIIQLWGGTEGLWTAAWIQLKHGR